MNQSYADIYPLFFRFYSHISHYKVLSRSQLLFITKTGYYGCNYEVGNEKEKRGSVTTIHAEFLLSQYRYRVYLLLIHRISLYSLIPTAQKLIACPGHFICPVTFNFSFSSVQFRHSFLFDSLQPHESQHARLPCPSPTPGVHSDSRPWSQ